MAFAAFDVLELDGLSALSEPWAARRKRIEDLLEAPLPGRLPRPRDRRRAGALGYLGRPGRRGHRPQGAHILYRPGIRSPSWLKLKPKLTLDVVVTGGSAEGIRWGDWGEAVMLGFRYAHPRTGADVEIRQAVRVPRDLPFDLKMGRAPRGCVLGRDAERDAAASGAPIKSGPI